MLELRVAPWLGRVVALTSSRMYRVAASVSIALAGWGLLPASAAPAGPVSAARTPAIPAVAGLRPVVGMALRHDLSPPLGSLRPFQPPSTSKVRIIPNPNPLRARARHAPQSQAPVRRAGVQRRAVSAAMPAFRQDFEGINFGVAGNPCQCEPPDTNGAVGRRDYVQLVNTSLAVWTKQGKLVFGPVDLATVWQGLGGACDPAADPANADGGDPVVVYDEQADRWFLSQLSYPGSKPPGGYHDCIAVSQTSDPAGAYYRYDFLASSTELNDYPKFGVWPDAYYLSVNDFAGNNFTGVTVVAFDRAAMLAGLPARTVSFTMSNPNEAYLLPANWEGGTLGQDPPAGAPDPFLMSCDAHTFGPCTRDQLDEWDFHVSWAHPDTSTFGRNGAPDVSLPTADFNGDLCSSARDCVPQPGTIQGLDPGADKLMYQAAYRDIAGTPTIVASQTVNASPTAGNQAAINWYELADHRTGWIITGQGTYAPGTSNRFMPSANIDVSGDLAVGYSVASTKIYPSIAVSGRLASDPRGQLRGAATLIAGHGAQISRQARWGDYSAMQVDPADGCTFWYTSEYYAATAEAAWKTRIGSFRFPSCSPTPGRVTGTVTTAGTPVPGVQVSALGETVLTTARGTYALALPPGTTTITTTRYGYHPQATHVTVTAGSRAIRNFRLAVLPRVTVSGTVTARPGTRWPLYARVSWIDATGHRGTAYTTPATGRYTLRLLADTRYTLTTTPLYHGYTTPAPTTVNLSTRTVTRGFTAQADPLACTAIGYHPVLTGTTQRFNRTGVPAGWRVTNINLHIPGYAHTPGWLFNDPGHRRNHTGGKGGFAIVDSARDGARNYQDTQLTSPAVNLSADQTPVVQFATGLAGATNSTATVGLSTDGGKTWTTIWRNAGTPGVHGPATITIPIPQATRKTHVRARFTYTGQDSKYWEIDDVFLGNRTCTRQTGGLLVGRVTGNSGRGIDGATITSHSRPALRAVTTSTPGNTKLDGGLYHLFIPATGRQRFSVTDNGYTSSTRTAFITAGHVSTLNFTLKPGSALPGPLADAAHPR